MATSEDLRRIALSLEGTVEAPRFDRTAFKAAKAGTASAPGFTNDSFGLDNHPSLVVCRRFSNKADRLAGHGMLVMSNVTDP